MSDGKLILTSMSDAVESLAEVIAQPKNEFIRDATIQRFEYTFELSWKMMQRHLRWAGLAEDFPTKRDLLREAAKAGLIDDADKWFDYYRARNQTSHTYDEDTAEEVYEAALKFLPDVQALLAKLKKHHD